MRRALTLIALAGLPLAAFADTFTFESYPVGPLAGNPGWTLETTTSPVVVSGVASPIGGGTKSVLITTAGVNERTGVNLATPAFTGTGYWMLSYDYRVDTITPGTRVTRVQIADGLATTGAQVFQTQISDNGELVNSRIFGGVPSAPTTLTFQETFISDPFVFPSGAQGRWYRVRYVFNMNDGTNPGAMTYADMSDITSGTPVMVAQRYPDVGRTFPINTTGFQRLVIRNDGTAGTMYMDNLGLTSLGTVFTPPADVRDPAPTPRNAQDTDVSVVMEPEVTYAEGFGDLPSLALVGNTLYSLDMNNGLASWDTSSQPPSPTILDPRVDGNADPDGEFVPETEPTSVMTVSSDGSKLYVVADNIAETLEVYRDLTAWDIAGGAWSCINNADSRSPTDGERFLGDHGVARTVIGGVDYVQAHWNGAQHITNFSSQNNRIGPYIKGVGNRWPGGATEAAEPNAAFHLVQTNADGLRISEQAIQQYNAIYKLVWGNTDSQASWQRISPSASILPWQTNCADGGCVNRHSLEYVPQTNCVWVTRAGNTNEIGIYSITNDKWKIVKLLRPDNTDFITQNVDLQLVGDRMYIMQQFETQLFSIDGLIAPAGGCRADFNGDNQADFFDYLDFAQAFNDEDLAADFNGDNQVDFFDYLDFAQAFNDGCD
jgi:hypothetical protein